MKIWKFPVSLNSVEHDQHVVKWEAPRGSKLLTALVQNGEPMVYMEVDPAQKSNQMYGLLCIGTGHGDVPFFGKWVYWLTLQQGPYVWHLYREES